jgi:5-methylcytosine-specific restriction endonuclease McrA
VPKRLQTYRPPLKAPQRPNAAARGYCSAAWRRTRLAVIARDLAQCQFCGKLVTGQDAQVDHIIEKPHGTDALSNLRLLCSACHARRHA